MGRVKINEDEKTSAWFKSTDQLAQLLRRLDENGEIFTNLRIQLVCKTCGSFMTMKFDEIYSSAEHFYQHRRHRYVLEVFDIEAI